MLLAAETITLLVVQPAELLQDLGVIWISIEHSSVGCLCGIVLVTDFSNTTQCSGMKQLTSFCCS